MSLSPAPFSQVGWARPTVIHGANTECQTIEDHVVALHMGTSARGYGLLDPNGAHQKGLYKSGQGVAKHAIAIGIPDKPPGMYGLAATILVAYD